MIHYQTTLTPDPKTKTIDHLVPIEVEGFGVLCNDCGAVFSADTPQEQFSLHNGGPCPKCSSTQCCCCRSCVRGGY